MGVFHQPDKKIPGPNLASIRGFPCFILKTYGEPYSAKAKPIGLGRSSDSPALLATFPSLLSEQWYTMAKRVPSSEKGEGQGYSGGPVPDLNGVPC